jgi:DNA polymerase III alpha subunit/intein/homing endonuclease
MSKDFVHLHLHSHYSLLDGAIKISDLAKKAQEYGYKAVALTDHGNIFGAIEFYQEMKKVGVKPIIGIEAYFTNNRFEKKGEGSDSILADKNYHLILHAKDKKGFQNLMKLSSLAYTEGFYYKPRIDWELLEKYHEGLICQTACLKGFIPHLLAKGQFEEAYKYAKRLKDIFGDDLYFEIQMNGLEEQDEANKGIFELAKKLGVKVVATNDSHYLNPEDKDAHDVIKALQMKMTLKELKEQGKAFKVSGLHFTRPEEMYEKFKGYEEALKNTMEIAEKCNVEIDTAETRGYLFPKYQIPGLDREATEEEKAQYFEKLAWEGLEKRLEKMKNLTPEKHREYKERLKYEIEVIKQMGFPEYFLIVQDFINYAKNNGIPVGPGRGCVLPDTKVLMADGSLKEIKDIKIGEFVITHKGNILPVVDFHVYDVEEEIVKLKVGADELFLTSDHKVWAIQSVKCVVNSPKAASVCKPTCTRYCSEKPFEDYDLEWIEAGKLKAGDFVVYPRVYSKNEEIIFDLVDFVEKTDYLKYDSKYIWYEIGTNKLKTKKIPRFIPFDEDLAKILGYYISEGYVKYSYREGRIGFGFHKDEIEFVKELQYLLKKVFEIDSKIYSKDGKNSLTLEANSKIVAQFLAKLGGEGAKNKRIYPEIIEKGKDEYVKTLISYLFRGDGHDGRSNKNLSIKYSTTSLTLASQIKFLLARFGYYASIQKRKKVKENWNIEYSVKLSGKQLLNWNNDFKNFQIPIPNQKFFRNDSFYIDDKYIYIKIREVKKVNYKGKVYDISVPFDTSYIGNNFAIHNSAAGSLVAYTLGITDVDPLQHGLIFERFLNPERISMPDIDVDFCQENRGKIIEYVKEKYGEQAVAQIITYNFMKSKMVLRDVARALGLSAKEGDKLAKMILPGPVQGSTLTIEENLEANPEFRKLYETDPKIRQVIDLAKKLEGLARHTGIHAAGVVIAPGNLEEFVPVYVDKDGTKATQFDMGTLEMLGLVKMDFLGLKTLTELDYMRKLIKERHGRDINFLELPIDDPKVYELLQSGRTTGVFQLESKGMQNLLTRLKPDKFDEIIAILALYRPGPLMSGMVDEFIERKHGRRPVEYPFDEVRDILHETYGLCLTGDTLITMADGSQKTIKEIVENNLVGEEVLSVDLKTNKLVNKKITHCFDNGIKDVYKITLQNGLEIKATADHKFLTPFGWKEVRELDLEKDLMAISAKSLQINKKLIYHSVNSYTEADIITEPIKNEDIAFIKIENIEYIGKQHVYDIEVEETHNFIANDIVSHNCIYQEQIMFMANTLSGFTMAEADTLRKAIGKKKADLMAKMKEKFINGAVERGFDKEKITKLWEDIEKFASYSFNKSHSTAYAYLTYWTAYIKAYYPEEFFTIKLSTEKNDDKFLNILNDMKEFGIELLPPDINKSEVGFNIEGKGKIRFGLARIKNVGETSAKVIIENRKQNGEYEDIFDIAERLDSKNLNKRVLEALIKAGAFDFTGVDRGIMLASVDKALQMQKSKEKKLAGQNSLFALMGTQVKPKANYVEAEPLKEKEKLQYEKEVLGFYISGHPLKAYEKELKNYVLKINELFDKKSGDRVRIAGVISDVKRKKTRTGNTMAILSLQDETGFIDVRVFLEKFDDTSFIEEDKIVIVEGTLDIPDEQENENATISMNALDIYPVEILNKQIKAVRFILTKEKAMNGVAEKLLELCKKHRGNKEVIIEINDKNFKAEILAHSNYYVNITDDFKHDLNKILEPHEFSFE